MSIATAITALQGKIANAYTAIENKGGTLPATQNAANLAETIADIPSGGGGGDTPIWGITALSDVCQTTNGGDLNLFGGIKNTITFSGVKTIPEERMICFAEGNPTITKVSFPDLGIIYPMALKKAFANCTGLTSVSFPKLSTFLPTSYAPTKENGAFLSTFAGCSSLKSVSFIDTDEVPNFNFKVWKKTFESTFKGCSSLVSVLFPPKVLLGIYKTGAFKETFDGCTSLSSVSLSLNNTNIDFSIEEMFYGCFRNCTSLSSVPSIFENITSLSMTGTNISACAKVFEGCTSLSSVSFTNLSLINSQYCFPGAFDGCTSLSSVSFPALKTLSNAHSCFVKAFNGCTSLTSVSFPMLSVISPGPNCFTSAFNGCTSLTSVSFPALELINSNSFNNAFNGTGVRTLSFPELTAMMWSGTMATVAMFYNDQDIVRMDFPKLTVISPNGTASGTDAKFLFNNCTNLVELHFSSENQAIIEASSGYSTKWGAPNANCQIYFDL